MGRESKRKESRRKLKKMMMVLVRSFKRHVSGEAAITNKIRWLQQQEYNLTFPVVGKLKPVPRGFSSEEGALFGCVSLGPHIVKWEK